MQAHNHRRRELLASRTRLRPARLLQRLKLPPSEPLIIDSHEHRVQVSLQEALLCQMIDSGKFKSQRKSKCFSAYLAVDVCKGNRLPSLGTAEEEESKTREKEHCEYGSACNIYPEYYAQL